MEEMEEEEDFFDAFRSLDWKLNIYSFLRAKEEARANESTRKGHSRSNEECARQYF